ncbi:glycerol-3-phosphate acyltransferase 1-like [Triticum aestivum]|nr:glycerol-3-phosphate acyltransferase 1-like [Triticum aestivum]
MAGYYNGQIVLELDNKAIVNELNAQTPTRSTHYGLIMDIKQVMAGFAACKVHEADKAAWQVLLRDKYPKPFVFHDGLAFTPTFSAAIAMYTYIPFGIFLAILRSTAYSLLPYRVSVPIGALTGMRSRIIAGPPANAMDENKAGGRLYVCNHRTLLDPITVVAGLRKPVTAVTYSVSPVSELMAPIRTARLTRDRDEDRRRMERLLARGNLVVCPEGTTCREPYLLRLSPLFAELAAEVTPIALETRVDMFYGTSTKPTSKVLDPLYFMMNPRPEYRVEFLEPVDTMTVADGHGHDDISHNIHVANRVQRVLGEALAFQLTEQTRKDKYMMLSGNEGIVKAKAKKS